MAPSNQVNIIYLPIQQSNGKIGGRLIVCIEDVVKILVWMGFIPGVRGVEMTPKRKAIIVSKQHIFLGMSMILMRTL